MSDMHGNPHYAFLMDQDGGYVVEMQTDRVIAQVEATLALAYEQRTANLLAFHAAIPGNAMDRSSRRLRADIMDRLGLEAAP